ncbi:DUF2607 family protein [Candidatus Thioglobus sp.]|uniref:DUF2607 family protein n=1 Tax=Candidatus Thioglobus sp. TaxID=2026721 RepID=UPI003D0DDE65
MINLKRTHHIHIALISILLLIGQFSVLIHSVEHPFHDQEQSCQVFLQCENSDKGLVSSAIQLPILASSTLPVSQIVSVWLSSLQSAYSARAPPFSS